MNELQRIAYLDALGIDGYVSRQQLPGAAVTRRLAVVRNEPEETKLSASASNGVLSSETGRGKASDAPASPLSSMLKKDAPAPAVPRERPEPAQRQAAAPVLQFQLAVTIAGQYLWVEELGDMPLRSEQVWLIEAMARALQLVQQAAVADASALSPPSEAASSTATSTATESAVSPNSKAEVIYFNWPLHNNPQLERGVDAARASLTGFIERKCEEYACRGIVLLGQRCSQWLPEVPAPIKSTQLPDTATLLADSTLKREAWNSLLAINSVD